ncbi:MAG TPA: trigger factor [Vicinamibacterales bacterium]|nr:trigger factor [Vicinamibacterales bacterium]
MKTEFTEVSETRKHLTFEVPAEAVDAEIARVAQAYSKRAKVPGFRQGKVPVAVVRQRYKEEILHDVTHDLIPRVVGAALRERGLEPVAAPDIRDITLAEGRPMTFLADFETMPSIELGEYSGLSLRKQPAVLEVGAVDRALEQLRERAARWLPVEDRPADAGDTILVDLTRTKRGRLIQLAGEATPADEMEGKPEKLENVSIEVGNQANPPGFNEQLTGAPVGATREFPVNYPADYSVPELAGATVDYEIRLKGIRRKELLPLDDDFAKEVSDLDSLEALRSQVQQDLQKGAEHDAEHKLRHDLLAELSGRIKAVPEALVEQEIDRRLEEFLRRLVDQGIDPAKTEIDWQEFRERQRGPAADSVKGTVAVDEVARREGLEATDEDVEKEVAKFAERSGLTAAAVRARLERDEAFDRIRAGVRREKTMNWLIEHANVT